jgi:hypothetical protein
MISKGFFCPVARGDKSPRTLNLKTAVEGFSVHFGGLFLLLKAHFDTADKLTRLRLGFGRYGQYRLSTLHIAKSSNEIGLSRSLRTPPTAESDMVELKRAASGRRGPSIIMVGDAGIEPATSTV